MDNDDQQVGTLLTRREMLKLLGALGAAMLVGCGPDTTGQAATACLLYTSPSGPRRVRRPLPREARGRHRPTCRSPRR